MAGIRIEYDDSLVRRVMTDLESAGTNLEPLYAQVGEFLLRTHRQRFEDEESPDGTPWEPLSDVTLARKKRNKDKILTHSGDMRGPGLRYQLGPDGLEFGSDRPYAAMMHFGGTKEEFPHLWGDIPARPWLGVSDDDEDHILKIARRFVSRHYGSG